MQDFNFIQKHVEKRESSKKLRKQTNLRMVSLSACKRYQAGQYYFFFNLDKFVSVRFSNYFHKDFLAAMTVSQI